MPKIESVSVNGKPLIVIRVPFWRGPFYLKSQGPAEGVYIRLGSTNRVAGNEFLEELKRSISGVSYDQLPCPDIDIKGLDEKRIQEAFSIVGKKIDKNKLETLGVLVPYSGKLVCSNGGLILFGKDEIRDRLFSNATIRCARFRGSEKVHFIDQYDCMGTIIEAMNDVPRFIERNTRLAAKIEKIHREDIPEYSPVAVREVLTNAFVHADYSIKGMCVRLAIFSDRLEIESPGMLPFGYTLSDFFAGVSHVRNKVIARVFRELNLMEEWGTGYKRVTEACQTGGYDNPEWLEMGTVVRVIFQPHPATSSETVKPAGKPDLTARQQKIISLIKEKGSLTAKEIYDFFQGEVTERTLRNDLHKLNSLGILEKSGGGPNTSWVFKKTH